MTPSPVWHPFTQHGLEEPIPRIVSASGAELWDGDGKRYLDAISSWWVTTHGHCHPRITAAIAEQAGKLDQVIFAGFTHDPAEEVAAGLLDLFPAPLAHAFFSDSGSTAVEVGLKMALGFWANRGEARSRIAVMEHSYHGDTVGGMSVGARGVFNRAYQPLLFDVATLPFPAAGAQQETLDALEAQCSGPDPLAALIVEPLVLGAGGMLMYDAATLAAMRAICARHDVLFIADEVMTGWGRTGTLSACEQADVVPDIMCLSKGITGGAVPLAVTLATPALFDAHWSSDKAKMFFHSSSYTANPIACAAAAANLAIWRDEPVRERIADLCTRQGERLARLAALPGVHGARQAGTITALEIGNAAGAYLSDLGPQLSALFRSRGVLLRPLGNTVYVMPPYCTTEAQLDEIYAAIEAGLDLLG
ncbi:adenosylmethionine--8-amino-7-oxononanoate transaminase [Stakelama sp. CBK3Z-3]|uniref:Adenosylmethionine-8-amino-7-oxononanoate aminotransferase n=1 Tax=Stakelama flava TaxID=2860338 RepID=A0ABS6XNK6_9SPHN|nr:adenosylmethionine--8-amino-7-oxononanoate transaminase [Stakelama flava]MBW4331020.1 adenosylmethionine--8-amino-7-oxononanoate transaminase [Stakelama flava]